MRSEIEILEVEKRIRTRVKKQMEKTQKEYYLNEQMRAIQKELGEKDEFKNEIQELEEKIKQKKMSAEAKEKAEKELKKLKMMSPMSAEATVVRNYIDWIISLPWDEYTEDKLDIDEAEKILEEDHYGLEKVKERILEYLAVQSLVGQMKGPILCLVGPPGVGKTSLGKSIARATGRKFVRVSLGGVRDEAEIRGHRRTYIGALPGKIIQSMKKAGSSNPVFLLDEVDKMSTDFRGDPSSALLEVLDPEQNTDLQRSLPRRRLRPLEGDVHHHGEHARAHPAAAAGPHGDHPHRRLHRDREAATSPSATWSPKQREANGLKDENIEFSDNALLAIIRHYTKEAGVRNLEREIAVDLPQGRGRGASRRTATRTCAVNGEEPGRSTSGRRSSATARPRRSSKIGVATGLAWTELGGELLATEVHGHAGQGQADHHRPARRRHAGVGPGGDELRALARRRAGARARLLPEASTSTFTSPKGPSPRTGRRPASPWRPPWSRRSPRSRCGTTWR